MFMFIQAEKECLCLFKLKGMFMFVPTAFTKMMERKYVINKTNIACFCNQAVFVTVLFFCNHVVSVYERTASAFRGFQA